MRRRIVLTIASVLVVATAVALPVFEPWRAFTSSHVDEADYVAAPASNSADRDASTTPAAPVTLGQLTATHGNQNYAIPPEVDLTGLQSVVIWCDRFNVSFGSAPVAL